MDHPTAPVVVWLPSARGTPQFEAYLRRGESLTFGRGRPDQPVEFKISDGAVSRVGGEIRPVADYWLISNFSRTATYVAENLEGAGEFVKAAPGRLDMPVPFEFSRVVLPGTEQPVSFRVTASQHAYADPGQNDPDLGDQTATPWPLDRTSRYFLVLVALCEPLLRDPSSTAMPTAAEIVRRLAGPGPNARWTTTAVHDQINYLATTKLRVRHSLSTAKLSEDDRVIVG